MKRRFSVRRPLNFLKILLVVSLCSAAFARTQSDTPKVPAFAQSNPLAIRLRHAADAGNTNQVLMLLSQGASAKDLGFNGLAPYVQVGSESMLALLLSDGANASVVSDDGQTLIYAAIAANNPAAISVLLRHHAPVHGIYTYVNPLRLALLRGMTGVAIALTKAGANPDHMSKHGNAVDIAQLMLDVGYLQYLTHVPPRPYGETTRSVRIGLRSLGYSRVISTGGPWNTALTRVTQRIQLRLGLPATGHPSRALLDAMERDLQAPYLEAARHGNVLELRLLQTAFPDLTSATDSAGFNALMLACLYARSHAVWFLLSSKISVNAVSQNGSNAILLAALEQQPHRSRARDQIIGDLVAAGADDAVKNSDGFSAQMIAARNAEIASAMEYTYTKPQLPKRFYIAVLSRPFGNVRNSWNCAREWPRGWLQSTIANRSARIVSISRFAGRWCIVTGDFVLGSVAQYIRDVTHGVSSESRKMQAEGNSLTDYATSADESMALYTNGDGVTDGFFLSKDENLRQDIRTHVWAKARTVIRIEPSGFNSWLVIFGNMMGYGTQSLIHGSLRSVLNGIHATWQQGKLVTSLSHMGSEWVAVLSTGTNEKDQSLIMATSFDSLSSKVRKENRNGGWRVDLITGGSMTSGISRQ